MSNISVSDSIFGKTDALLLRSLLIRQSAFETINELKNQQEFLGFLETIESTLEYDKEFFFLQDYLDKTQHIIRLGSQKFSTIGAIRQKENENIIELNKLSMTKNQDKIVDQYLGGEYAMREYVPYTDQLLFVSMVNDYYIMNEIQKEMYDYQSLLHLEPRQFLASTSYFTYIVPELYENYPICVEMTEEFIKELPRKRPELKRYAKKVKNRLDLFN